MRHSIEAAEVHSECSPTHDSPFHSPQKSKLKQSVLLADTSESATAPNSLNGIREFEELIDDYPTTGQPITDTTLKDMLVCLRGSLHLDMLTLKNNVQLRGMAKTVPLADLRHYVQQMIEETAESKESSVEREELHQEKVWNKVNYWNGAGKNALIMD